MTIGISEHAGAVDIFIRPRSAKHGKGARIAPTPTHTEIARIGVIVREKDTLVVTDLERLAEMVHAATGE